MAAGLVAGATHRVAHPGGDLGVGLAPRGPHRVPQVPPLARARAGRRRRRRPTLPSKMLPASMRSASVPIGRPKAAAVGAAVSCARSSGEAVTTVMSRPASALGRPLGHLPAQVGQVEVRQAPVEHAPRVVDLAVAQQVDGRALAHGSSCRVGVRCARRTWRAHSRPSARPTAHGRRPTLPALRRICSVPRICIAKIGADGRPGCGSAGGLRRAGHDGRLRLGGRGGARPRRAAPT